MDFWGEKWEKNEEKKEFDMNEVFQMSQTAGEPGL